LANDGDAREQHIGEVKMIEGRENDIFWSSLLEGLKALQNADGADPVEAEESVDGVVSRNHVAENLGREFVFVLDK
jgi:hypothetical protein